MLLKNSIGQIVNTPNGEEFVPGQLVESATGKK